MYLFRYILRLSVRSNGYLNFFNYPTLLNKKYSIFKYGIFLHVKILSRVLRKDIYSIFYYFQLFFPIPKKFCLAVKRHICRYFRFCSFALTHSQSKRQIFLYQLTAFHTLPTVIFFNAFIVIHITVCQIFHHTAIYTP